MPINSFLYPGAKVTTAYEVANSLRFDDGSSDYLSKTFSSYDSTKKFTISVWLKKSANGVHNSIYGKDGADDSASQFYFDSSSEQLRFYDSTSSSAMDLVTNRLFRDPSAWYNIILAVDTTQGTASNRVKIYVNGTQETSFSTETYPAQDSTLKALDSSKDTFIGVGEITNGNKFGYFNGYMSEYVFIDGSQLTPTSFGEFDEDSPTIWKPINVSGLTFGTAGFYLDFEDSSSLGNDVAGSNNFTVNNLAATDQTTDTCTNNFCTWNPLDQTNTGGSSATMAEGNLKWTSSGNGTSQNHMRATFGLTAGKWYWEAKMSNSNSGRGFNTGVTGSDANMNAGSSGNMPDADPNTCWANNDSGDAKTRKDGSDVTTGLTAITENDILQVALDLDNQKIYFGVNGTWQNSADPAAGSNAPATVDANTTYIPACSDSGYSDAITLEFNFGNPTFSISSGNADANGYGNFEYSVPSGYYSLCTKNLAEYGG